MSPLDAVQAALLQFYGAFARVPRPSGLAASPLREGEESLRLLCATPLRDLTGEQIGPYAGWAITTVGDEHDYRYFLPRILELAVWNPLWLGTCPQVVAGKLRLCQWEHWPTHERDVLLDVFRAAFQWTLTLHPDERADASSWLCGLARLDAPIEPLLRVWRSSTTPHASLQLASFVTLDLDELSAKASGGDAGFWADVATTSKRRVGDWLRSAETREQMRSVLDLVAPADKWLPQEALRVLAIDT